MTHEYNWMITAVFAPLFIGAFGYHISAVRKYWKMIKKAQPQEFKSPISERIKSVVVNVIFQKKLFKKPVRGVFHVFIFYGFLTYGLHTTSQFIGGFIGDYHFYLPALLGEQVRNLYDYLVDIFSILVLVGLGYFAIRRWVLRAPELDRPSSQSIIVIGLIGSLMIFTLIGEGAHQVLNPSELASPIRLAIASFYQNTLSLDSSALEFLFKLGWWGHIASVFIFMVFLPTSKHAHLLWAPVNFWFKRHEPKGALPFLDTENAPVWGAANIHEFTWNNLLDGLSCIECGRCQLECPANRTGKKLSPKSIMTDLKHALMEKMEISITALNEGKSLEEMATLEGVRVIDQYTSTESLWACTTCYACVEACPVGNNQVDSIIAMRRSLVLNEGSLPNEVQAALTNIENQSNPWGVGAHKREEWAEGLNVKTMAQWKEANESPDILFWVGCAGAFDDRNVEISKAMVSVLNKADIKFGILGTEENCTGDSARRAGNEYLFQTMAQSNIETFANYNVKKIVTACPHCFNTIKNEYPQLGGNYDVIHHSELISQLVKDDTIQIDEEKQKTLEAAVFHDSCYLGRYNDVYDAPRETIAKATGQKVLEAVDTKTTSLCCGAGGAQMWKEEEAGDERVNSKRTKQLVDTGAKTIATACPFCITMIYDGVKEQEKEEEIKVVDIVELVDQATK